MAKRLFLFLAVNILVILTISISFSLLGVKPYITQSGLDYQALLIFCAILGFTGSFISLALSKTIAKFSLGVVVIDPNQADSQEARFLVNTVQKFAGDVGIGMPEVGIYDSPEVNAFATGARRNSSLIAVSTGLLREMDKDAIEGVLAHEVAHVANGDMVTMTLIQGVINTFVMFFARIISYAVVSFFSSDDEDSGPPPYFITMMVTLFLEIILSILGSVVTAYFSRIREFAADKGGADLAGRRKMIHALETLQRKVQLIDTSHPGLETAKISNREGFIALLSTHPPLASRIEYLKSLG